MLVKIFFNPTEVERGFRWLNSISIFPSCCVILPLIKCYSTFPYHPLKGAKVALTTRRNEKLNNFGFDWIAVRNFYSLRVTDVFISLERQRSLYLFIIIIAYRWYWLQFIFWELAVISYIESLRCNKFSAALLCSAKINYGIRLKRIRNFHWIYF